MASEWSERKGLKDFYQLAQRLPRNEYAIVIVGKILGEMPDASGDGCHMVFIERTQNQLELAYLYSLATVFVNPTYQDNYPTTNLEAMACGTPVITYNTGGSPEAVDDETGAIVEQGDVRKLEEEIVRLSQGDYSERCRQRAEMLFDNNIAYNQYIKLYNKLLGGGKNSLEFRADSLKLVLGVSSVWSKSKGLVDFIELSKRKDLLVVMVGVSDDVRKMLPPEIVAINRTQNQQELAMLYSMADVFVNPTYADMYPTVNLEAMACGTPVATYRTGGSPEAVILETGYVVEQGDVDGLVTAIDDLCSRDKTRLSRTCRERGEREFDKKKCFEKYLELYEELLTR